MNAPQTEYDSPWKDILRDYFPEFMQFFFPKEYEQIDWEKGFEFLDKELQQVVRDAELGRRWADKLVKFYLKDGTEARVLLHIEVQSQEESNFPQRMFTYNYRTYDYYKLPVASFAILGDENSNWRPEQFSYNVFGSGQNFKFKIKKLLDYKKQWSKLEKSTNPFATVVMAHLKALETTNNRQARKQWKLILTKRLYEQNYPRQDVINLFHFIDWMMTLPKELEQDFWQEFQQFEENKSMRYITSVEKFALEKGHEQGHEEGLEEGLLEAIELGLDLRFGNSGLALLPEISQIQDSQKLRTIKTALKTVNTLEELRQIYQPSTND